MTDTNPGEHTRTELVDGCAVIDRVHDDADRLADLGASLEPADRVYLLGCGSSLWTGRIVAALLRARGVDARAVQASDFLFTPYPVTDETTVLGLSQSGETSETVGAVERAVDEGARALAITNTADSTLDDLSADSYVTPAGTEEAVLATKSVDATVAAGYLLATGLTDGADADALSRAADACRTVLETDLDSAADLLGDAERAYTVGLGPYFGLAGEAATKLGEGPLVQTTALPGLEISHGPLSNADDVPVLLFPPAPTDRPVYEDLLNELDAAGARTLAVHPEGEEYDADVTVEVPAGDDTVLPALKLVQRLTLDLSLRRGLDPDSPPSLTKHVEWQSL